MPLQSDQRQNQSSAGPQRHCLSVRSGTSRFITTRCPSNVFHASAFSLFGFQLRNDFTTSDVGSSPPLTMQDLCLGLAVLDLWRLAKEQHQSVKDLCKSVRYGGPRTKPTCSDPPWPTSCCVSSHSYKSCLPKSHRVDIEKRNWVERLRIRNTLKHFLKKFGNCPLDECNVKLMYLSELTGIQPSLGSETFHVDPSSSCSNSQASVSLVRVTGEFGIQTCEGCDGAVVSSRSVYLHLRRKVSGAKALTSFRLFCQWQTFCDFKEITDVSIKRICREQVPHDSRMVTISLKDIKCLVRDTPTLCLWRRLHTWLDFTVYCVSAWLWLFLLFCFPMTGSGVPGPQGSPLLRVAGRRLLQADHGLHPLLLPWHRSSEHPGRHQKPLSRSNHVSLIALPSHIKHDLIRISVTHAALMSSGNGDCPMVNMRG